MPVEIGRDAGKPWNCFQYHRLNWDLIEGEPQMKKVLFISACAIALSIGGAFAQNQPAPGASSEGNVGPGATRQMTHHMKTHHMKTRHMANARHMTKTRSDTTTGMATTSSSRTTTRRQHTMTNPSSEGNVGPGTNNNAGRQPGGR